MLIHELAIGEHCQVMVSSAACAFDRQAMAKEKDKAKQKLIAEGFEVDEEKEMLVGPEASPTYRWCLIVRRS